MEKHREGITFSMIHGVSSAPSLWHKVRVIVEGREIRVSVDGRRLGVVHDASIKPGFIGLLSYSGIGASAKSSFRNLRIRGQVADAPAPAELDARLDADENDHEARLLLALHKVVGQEYEVAMELLLDLMRKDREFGDDAGRQTLLKVFELLGDDPLVGRYRSRMASLLY